MTTEGETVLIDVPIHPQLSALLFLQISLLHNLCRSCSFHFYATCAEVIFQLLPNLGRSWVLDFQPTWSEVHFLFPTSCREVGFQNSVQLGQNNFFEIFPQNASKNAFLVGYHLERFFENCSWATHKKFGFLGHHLRRTMDKKRFSPATTWESDNQAFMRLRIN